MTSLSEAYERNETGVSSPKRLYAGTALVVAGAALAVVALVVATTDVFSGFVGDEFAARRLAGVLGGLAVPAVLVGVFTVLPAGRRALAGALISASICLLGVSLFAYAYPSHWAGYGRDLTPFVSAIYLVGLLSATWCLFTAIARFKMRNDPGGALEMTVTRTTETKVVEVDRSSEGGMGGIGLLGATPDGNVETQTNRNPQNASSGQAAGGAGRTTKRTPATDGHGGHAVTGAGASVSSTSTAGSDDSWPAHPATKLATRQRTSSDDTPDAADRYCGTCAHFEYGRDASGMVPYCLRHEEKMDDMDPCEEWTRNGS